MKFSKRLFSTLIGAALLGASTLAAAASYPEKPVTIVIPFSPGGATDTLGRILAEKLHDRLGQPFIVENRPGAGTIIASNHVAGSKPDGYTLLLAASSLGIAPSVYDTVKYDPIEDFEPITQVASVVHVLGVNPDVPVENIQELIEYLKANPGKLSYASVGVGTSTQLEAELFNQMAGVDMRGIPYKGSAPALTDMVAGRIDVMFDAWASTGPFAKDGKIKVLAVTTKDPSPSVPGVPPIATAVPGFAAMPWLGLVAPKGTPDEAVQTIYTTVNEILKDDDIKARFTSLGLDVIGNNPEEFQAFIANDINTWKQVVDKANIRAE